LQRGAAHTEEKTGDFSMEAETKKEQRNEEYNKMVKEVTPHPQPAGEYGEGIFGGRSNLHPGAGDFKLYSVHGD